jgi:hypothetical protein
MMIHPLCGTRVMRVFRVEALKATRNSTESAVLTAFD